jgi:hypothetical protein
VTTTPAHQAIATWLRGYLAERRIPHAELARRVDIPQQKFSRKMTGKTPFTIDELTVVVRELGIDYASMVNEVANRLRRSDAQKILSGEGDAVTLMPPDEQQQQTERDPRPARSAREEDPNR